MSPSLLTILGFFLLLPNVIGYSWGTSRPARQCSNITVTVGGTDFIYPLKALIIPVGPSPLSYEVRKVIEVAFPVNSTAVSFPLPYPAGSEFVVLVSDGSGFLPGAVGNTSSIFTVSPSDTSSCFDATRDAVSPFSFSLFPRDIAECRDVRIYWDSASVRGTPSFLAVIPNGKFTPIQPLGKIDTRWVIGTGFTWTPAVNARTNLIIVGSDNRGMGFISNFVKPGDPASSVFGVCPQPAPQNTTPSSGAIIAGGVVGGIAILGLLLFIFNRFFLRKETKSKVVDPDDEPPAPNPVNYGEGGTRYDPRVSIRMPQQPVSDNTRQEIRHWPPVYINRSGTAAGAVINGGQQGPISSWQGSSRDDVVHLTWDGRV